MANSLGGSYRSLGVFCSVPGFPFPFPLPLPLLFGFGSEKVVEATPDDWRAFAEACFKSKGPLAEFHGGGSSAEFQRACLTEVNAR